MCGFCSVCLCSSWHWTTVRCGLRTWGLGRSRLLCPSGCRSPRLLRLRRRPAGGSTGGGQRTTGGPSPAATGRSSSLSTECAITGEGVGPYSSESKGLEHMLAAATWTLACLGRFLQIGVQVCLECMGACLARKAFCHSSCRPNTEATQVPKDLLLLLGQAAARAPWDHPASNPR